VTSPHVEWIILDVRSNFGGNLQVLNALLYYLYGNKIMDQVIKCVDYTYATNHEFLTQYYEQVVKPVLMSK